MEVQRLGAKKYRCRVCHRPFTCWERLQHHHAAEHAPRTMKDVRTSRDLPMVPKGRSPIVRVSSFSS